MKSKTTHALLIVITFFCFKIDISAQSVRDSVITFKLTDFSEDYYSIVSVKDTSDPFTSGCITIYDKRTNKELIKIESDELALDIHEGKIKSNIRELPYGEQSLIMYDDFNFDGIKDLAIEDGQNSCYHGPSYQIYLGTKAGFTYDSNFTRLAQEYCGMFEINSKNKEIHTMVKDGCCYHQFTDFIIKNNVPTAKSILEEDGTRFPYYTETIQAWNGTKMVKTSKTTIDLNQSELKIVFTFNIKRTGNKVVLFNINNRTLNYALIRKDSTVELSYPITEEYKAHDFIYSSSANQTTVVFISGKVKYTIYDNYDANSNEEIGIEADTDGKITDNKGDINTKKGSLIDVLQVTLDNVVNK